MNEILSARGKELFYKKSSRIAASYLRRLETASGTPEEMMPFFEVLRRVYVEMRSPYEKMGRVMVGTFCAMVPDELIYAAGAYPVRLCSGSFTAYSISDGLAARDACPLVKAVAGFACSETMPLYDDCSLMVIPITCDCKKKIAGLLGAGKKTVVMQIPQEKHADGDGEVFRREIYRFIPRLEEVTGREITAKTLAEAINRIGYAQYEMSRFLKHRRNIPPLLSGAQAMAAMNAYAYMPVDVWADAMRGLNGELEKRLEGKKFVAKGNRPRILLTGSPVAFPNISGWYGWLPTPAINVINKFIAVISTVGKDIASFNIYMFKDGDCEIDIIPLPFTDHYVNRITICIHSSMDFCAWTAAAVPDFVRRAVFSGASTMLMGLDNRSIYRDFT